MEELKKQIKEIQINSSKHDYEKILRTGQQLDKLICEFIKRRGRHYCKSH